MNAANEPRQLLEQQRTDVHAELVALRLAVELLLAAQEVQTPGFSRLARGQLNAVLGRLSSGGQQPPPDASPLAEQPLPDGTLLGQRVRAKFEELLARADEVAKSGYLPKGA